MPSSSTAGTCDIGLNFLMICYDCYKEFGSDSLEHDLHSPFIQVCPHCKSDHIDFKTETTNYTIIYHAQTKENR